MSCVHPFCQSCVERDMLCKAFAEFWCLRTTLPQRFWRLLFEHGGISLPPDFLFDRACQVKFSPYPKHHGATSQGEIADACILDPSTFFFCLDSKRPAERLRSSDLTKVDRAVQIASKNGWPSPTFTFVGTNLHVRGGKFLALEWSTVADVREEILGCNPGSDFLREQIDLRIRPQRRPRAPASDNQALTVLLALADLRLLPAPDYLERPVGHFSFRGQGTPVVAVPNASGGLALKLKQIPAEFALHVNETEDYFSNSFGRHRYTFNLQPDSAEDPETQRIVVALVRHAFNME